MKTFILILGTGKVPNLNTLFNKQIACNGVSKYWPDNP